MCIDRYMRSQAERTRHGGNYINVYRSIYARPTSERTQAHTSAGGGDEREGAKVEDVRPGSLLLLGGGERMGGLIEGGTERKGGCGGLLLGGWFD